MYVHTYACLYLTPRIWRRKIGPRGRRRCRHAPANQPPQSLHTWKRTYVHVYFHAYVYSRPSSLSSSPPTVLDSASKPYLRACIHIHTNTYINTKTLRYIANLLTNNNTIRYSTSNGCNWCISNSKRYQPHHYCDLQLEDCLDCESTNRMFLNSF